MEEKTNNFIRHYSTGYFSTGDSSAGKFSTGLYSTGNYSTGNYSTGSYSTGSYSTGDLSTGHYSTGYCSTGKGSTGDSSTGDRSTGNDSTGHFSTGHLSTGNCSISNYSTGHFSTIDFSGYGWFDKPCNLKWSEVDTPSFLFFNLTQWVPISKMTDQEKLDNKNFLVTKGYLKVYKYKEAWANFWKKTPQENKEKFYKLPNFDPKVFEKITGIDVTNENNQNYLFSDDYIMIKGKKYKLVEEK